MKRDDWDLVLQTNLSGSFFCIQQVLPAMMRERWGRIVNISSVVGEAGNAGQANYVASKAGLIGLTKSLAQEMGIAQCHRERGRARLHRDRHDGGAERPDEGRDQARRCRWGGLGKPEDIAAAVRFLCSEEASYITGHVLDVNGGMYMR